MSIRNECPCDLYGVCPYGAEVSGDCEYWCSAEEPEDYPDDCNYEVGYDPYSGCFTDDV